MGANGSDRPNLGVEEAAEYLTVSPATLRALVRRREVPAYRVSKFLKFSQSDLDAYLRRARLASVPEVEL